MTDGAMTGWRWPHFTREELACKGGGGCHMQPEFMDRLERLRVAYGKPMVVTSGYRSPEYNAKISKTGTDGPHTTGRAIDIAVAGADALELVGIAIRHGFTGVGIKQKGVHNGRFIHLDDLLEDETEGPRRWLWTY